MEFLFGILGAGAGLGLFFAGMKYGGRAKRPAPALMEQTELEQLRQEAFRQLQNYSAEQAYGLGREREVRV